MRETRALGKSFKIIFLIGLFSLFIFSGMAYADTWVKTYGSGSRTLAYSVRQTSDGGYVTAGLLGGLLWIIKCDQNGDIEWQKKFSGAGAYEISPTTVGITQTTDSGYIVATHRVSDFLVLKLDSSGNVEWWKTYGGNNIDIYPSVQQTTDGGYIVAGTSTSFGGVWVLKLNANGDIQWQKTYGTGTAYHIQQTKDGGFIVAGHKDNDLLLLKLDSTGNIEWGKSYGGGDWDTAYFVQQTTDGGYIVSGENSSFGADNYGDPWVLKFDTKGNIEWQKIFSNGLSLSDDRSYEIQQTTDGGYIVVAATSLTGPVSNQDALILKLDLSGNIEWQKAYGGTYGNLAFSVQQTIDGGYIVAGGTSIGSSWGVLLMKLDSNGNVSNCSENIIEDISVTVIDTNATVNDLNLTVQDSTATPKVYSGSVIDTDETLYGVCAVSELNQSPAAYAGSDQTISCSSSDGASVTLDGLGSSDSDGDTLTYTWTGIFGTAEGVNPTVQIPLGTYTITLKVDDGKGGTSEDTVSITVEDRTPPSTTAIITGAAGNNNWYKSDVNVNLTSTDNCAGCREIHYTFNGSETVVSGSTTDILTNTDGTHSLNYWAVDHSGNLEQSKSSEIKIDKTSPAISVASSPSPDANGWNNTDVTVTFTCYDATSGIASCTPTTTVTTEGIGQAITGEAIDNAGNTANTSITLNIDKTPPDVTISGISDSVTYQYGNVPSPAYTVADNLSGVASSSDSDTYDNGTCTITHTYAVTASDIAGNEVTKVVTYYVTSTSAGVKDLVDQMVASGLITNDGIANSLKQQAENGNWNAFINHVNAQTGKFIDSSTAELLIQAANIAMQC